MKPRANLVIELEKSRDEAKECEHELITDQGWVYQTSEQDFRWRWYKQIDGVMHCVDQDTAVSFAVQSFIQQHPTMVPERD